MLTAQSDRDRRTARPGALCRDLQNLANSLQIESVERIVGVNLLRNIVGDKSPRVVARQAKYHLGQVVGAETEKIRLVGNIVGAYRSTGVSIITPTW